MKCPKCEEEMDLEYAERKVEEWYCGECEISIEKDGNKVKKYELSKKEVEG